MISSYLITVSGVRITLTYKRMEDIVKWFETLAANFDGKWPNQYRE